MARNFGGDLDADRIYVNKYSGIATLETLTYSFMFYREGADSSRIISKRSEPDFEYALLCGASDDVRFYADRWDTTGYWQWTVMPTQDTWVHVCLRYNYGSVNNNPDLYYDGVAAGGYSEKTAPAGSKGSDNADLVIGNEGTTRAVDGALAEFAVYNAILGGNEVNALANHVPATRIRPAALVGYWPIYGDTDPEPNYTAGNNGTVYLTTKVKHPPVAPFLAADARFAAWREMVSRRIWR